MSEQSILPAPIYNSFLALEALFDATLEAELADLEAYGDTEALLAWA